MTPKVIRFSQLRHHWTIYFFALPSLLFIGLFLYYPAVLGAVRSVFRWNGADINEFTGTENYRTLLFNPEFWRSFRVSLVIGAWNILKMIPAIAVAICIHRCKSEKLQFLYRVLFVAPMVVPGLVIILIWRSFFFEATSGYLNQFLMSTGFFDVLVWLDNTFHWGGIFQAGHKPAWLGDGRLLLFACIAWGFPWVGSFAVLTHLAKLGNIPRELYEAADLDGVTWWTKFTTIELPLMMGSINMLLVFVIIDTIKDAGMVLALAGIEGGPGGVVQVPALFMLRKAFVEQQMGAACAVGIVLTVVVMAIKRSLDAINDWESLSVWQKARVRLSGLAFAAVIWTFLDLTIIPVLIVLAVIPWPTICRRLSNRLHRQTPPADHWHSTQRDQTARQMQYARLGSPFYRWRTRLAASMLTAGRHGLILLVLACAYLPLYLMLIVSVKDNNQFYDHPATITTPMHWGNWLTACELVVPPLANSVFVTTASTALTLLLALGAAYFFARVKVPGSKFLWHAILVLIMMPTIANLVPLFRLLIDMRLENTLSALILVGAAGGQVFAIFVLRGFVADIPQDLFEAAEIDGASHLRQMFTIVAPLAGPILGVVGIMHAVREWNEFVLPLVIMRDASRLPVMVAILRMNGEYIKLWGPLMASFAMASVPIIVLFILCMRLFTRGLTAGAVKG